MTMHRSLELYLASLFLVPLAASAETYDPLRATLWPDQSIELSVQDRDRQRDIPVRVYLPRVKSPAPVVLFSHGLGGSRGGCAYLGEHWAARGYVAVFLQHPGSDDSVWKEERPARRMAALRSAAGYENFRLRVDDVPAVLDQLESWNQAQQHALQGRLDLNRIGMSGHSFGAITTQAVSGQQFPWGMNFTDTRIRAAVLMSPSIPRRGHDPATAFGKVSIPWFCLTGTEDQALIGDADPASRLQVFSALPAGNKYELVLNEAEHSAFSDRPLPGDRLPRNPNHHRAILALTTAFWDAHLKDDPAARQWLDGTGPRTILESADRWQRK
jgi:predicted dienelactone hydrolase